MSNSKLAKFSVRLILLSGLIIFLPVISALKHDDAKNPSSRYLAVTNGKLDANNINTWFRTNGSFNSNPFNMNNPGFEWPKASGKFARFASGIWIGARVGNDTLVAVAEYSYEYLPGYTDNNGVPQGQNDPLYRIYKLVRGSDTLDRSSWPNILLGNSDQGAPVYFDSQTNSWKPLDFGKQTLFYRITDSYPQSHTRFNTAPLKADVMRLDFSLDTTGLADVAFSQFTIINRSNTVWNNAYLTVWTDDDLGEATDDRVGCDSARNLGYTYNGDNNDPVYGSAPPAVGFVVLRGGLTFTGNNNDTVYICRNKTRTARVGYKDLKMKVFNWYCNGCGPINGDPLTAGEAYRYMSGLRRDGSPIINPFGNYITKYMYSGDPVTSQGWIQTVSDDQRFLLSSGPVNMNPGDTQVIVVAQLIAQGTSNLNSITRVRELTDYVKTYYNSCYSIVPIGIEPISNEIPKEFKLYQNYPNPFNPKTVIRYSVSRLMNSFVSLRVFDALGREVSVLVDKKQQAGSYEVEWDAANFPSGVYFYKLSAGEYSETRKMVLLR